MYMYLIHSYILLLYTLFLRTHIYIYIYTCIYIIYNPQIQWFLSVAWLFLDFILFSGFLNLIQHVTSSSSIILGRRKPMGSIPTLGHATLENSTISCQTQGAAWFMTNVLHISKIYVLKVLFGRSANRFQTYQYNIAIFINLHHLDFFWFLHDRHLYSSFLLLLPSHSRKYPVFQKRETLHTTRPAYFSSTARESCPERLPCVRIKQCRWHFDTFLCKFPAFTSWIGLKVEVSTESFKGYIQKWTP